MPSACAASAGSLRLLRAGARLGHGLERPALVRRVALHRLDEVRDEVPAPLELHLDLRPGVVDAVPQPDEPVVERDEQERRRRRARRRCTMTQITARRTLADGAGDEDHVLLAVVRPSVEPAVHGLDGEAGLVEEPKPLGRREPVQAERSSRRRPSGPRARASARPRPSRRARRCPGSRSSQSPFVSSMSSRLGAKTSKTKRPSGSRRPRAARSARSFSSSVSMCRSERNGQMTSGTRSVTGGSRRSPRRRSTQLGHAGALGRGARDGEHPGRGVDADHVDPGPRDRDRDPAGSDGELDDRAARRERLRRRRSRRPPSPSGSTGRRTDAISS